ncbi:MarR family transcriptional regulator [Arthrobacter sp. APC 3897]|uniref:MarR family winged helix-turn-helix transcriptional regulator n=1 Tax=Arthrobacter sp. APC 3897 TaxID=3035204 RepID=UPI0025B35BB0|nr:MarR family transcriptional regulator [Arthrobacter sp. APC 3897]MDN3481762.1 MarR family transcriptional regulator [Arthrobacter sp. APC 3897]
MEDKDLRRSIINAIRGMSLDGQRVADIFAHRHGLNNTDMRALTLIMEAEIRDEALTAGRLSTKLGTSSGATTAVIDRLERIGHIRRNREHADRRKVTLHYEPLAMQLAGAYFGPLGVLTDEVMNGYTTEELATVHRFMEDMRAAYSAHQSTLQQPLPPSAGAAPEQDAP